MCRPPRSGWAADLSASGRGGRRDEAADGRRRRRRDLAPAGERVARVLGRTGGRAGGAAGGGPELARARAVWAEVAGTEVAAQSVPVRMSRAGTLTIACASASWAQELSARAEELVVAMAAAARAAPGGATTPPWGVRGLRFLVADGALPGGREAPAPAPAPAPPPPPTTADRRRARELVGPVRDPRLRALLERAAAVPPRGGATGPEDRQSDEGMPANNEKDR